MYEALDFDSCIAVCRARSIEVGRGRWEGVAGIQRYQNYYRSRRGHERTETRKGVKGCYVEVTTHILDWPHTLMSLHRLLLTHSSGIAYDGLHPLLLQWRRNRNEKPFPGITVETRFFHPLVFEPGTSWMYGAGYDWAGKMVERVNPGMTLETYFDKNIYQPLDIRDMTFFVQGKHDIEERRAGMSVRKEPGGKVMPYGGPLPFDGMTDCMGGQGLNACAPEYLKVLHSILVDDEKLLKKESVVQLFTPQLTDLSQKALMKLLEDPDLNRLFGATLPMGCKKDWGLGGLLCMEQLPGWKSKGTLTWTGMPNLCWVCSLIHPTLHD